MIVCLSLLAVLPVIKVQLRCDRSYKTSTKPHKTSTNPPEPVIFQDFNVDVGHGGVEHFAQACGADMQPSVESLVRLLESHRGRDKLVSIRTKMETFTFDRYLKLSTDPRV